MQRYEYKVVPAPRRGQRARGVKGTDGKFANALQQVMNECGSEGWEYLRTDTLPCEERAGLTRTKTVYQNLMVFRRPLPEAPGAYLAEAAVPRTTPDEAAETIRPAGDDAPRLGGVSKAAPGKTAKAPDIAAQ